MSRPAELIRSKIREVLSLYAQSLPGLRPGGATVLSEERRREILERLQSEGRVLVGDLAKRFKASQITIRKDLGHLHHEGLLERTHGGALPVKSGALKDRSLQETSRLHRAAKLRIAAAATLMIREGQVVILDSGTTTAAIASACRHFKKLTIITNSTNIATDLAETKVEVILTGGVLRQNSYSLVGPLAEESLRDPDGHRMCRVGGCAIPCALARRGMLSLLFVHLAWNTDCIE